MDFKWDVSIGNVISFLALSVTVIGIYGHMALKLGRMEAKFNIMFTWFQREIIGRRESEVKRFFGEKPDQDG